MIVTGNLQLDIDVSKRTEIDEAIKLLESLILQPVAIDSDIESSLESAVSNEDEESLALDKAAEELDQKYRIADHDRKSGSSHVMEKLPPKILESKLKQFKDIFDKYVPENDEISSYRILKPILKAGLADNNAEGRELIRIALRRNLIKETRSEVYSH